VKTYRESFLKMQAVTRQLEKLENAERDREQRLDFLQHQSAEIADAELSVEEEQALLAERLLLQNAERLVAVARGGYDALYDSDGSVCEVLGSLSTDLQAVAEVDKKLATLSETVQRNLFELEDVAVQMRSYLTNASFEPDRIDAVEERLGLLNRLKRKYAPTIGEILELKEAYDREIVQLENAGETRVSLLEELAALKKQTGSLGQSLSVMRSKAAATLARALVAELGDLAMSGASFEVALTDLEQPGPDGLERLEFMVSLNPGEPLMPLTRVASGGELSRLMLALRRIAPDAGLVPTIIFDEVDAGIGGAAATAVGRKLQSVSRSAQVLCVTHLPQVAAFADHHHRVTKHEVEGRTIAVMELLSGDDRVKEMARMLGGAQVTGQTILHAKELIDVSAKS
jgi:DNA repair protein RecN (Recombination protein N)